MKYRLLWSEPLQTQFFRSQDSPYSNYYNLAKNCPNTLIDCKIGKSSLKQNSKSTQNKKRKNIKVDGPNKYRKIESGKKVFGIKYQQGKQNLCFQRGLQSAIYHCKSLQENMYKNKDSIEYVKVTSRYDKIHNDIEKSLKRTFDIVINHPTFLLGEKKIKYIGVPDTISKIMQHNRWNCVRIDKKFITRRVVSILHGNVSLKRTQTNS